MARISSPALVMGISSDILYPSYQQRQIDEVLRSNGTESTYVEIDSPHGHDAFLLDDARYHKLVAAYFERIQAELAR